MTVVMIIRNQRSLLTHPSTPPLFLCEFCGSKTRPWFFLTNNIIIPTITRGLCHLNLYKYGLVRFDQTTVSFLADHKTPLLVSVYTKTMEFPKCLHNFLKHKQQKESIGSYWLTGYLWRHSLAFKSSSEISASRAAPFLRNVSLCSKDLQYLSP